ncbi:hypothetical protein D3D02_05435 [Halobellus sp. Atlit-38R]|jgi:hypothetical protein|uniref:DUF7266 family protein n=1 Tax=Halobellus sp. Atlit-38R TaxID=2282131 RepID=UPI000EF2429C|nr:hypothetical protein [Halobellus sp. Atlit-38R]RLM90211.1 hypothetical protein D3D02_05435 [Halobellus sp. Atlit-38R]
MSTHDRAVSITVNYVIALSITAVLISGLLIAGGGYVESERDRVVREELEVIAEQLAVGIDDADRLARATESPSELRVGVDLPARVASETYRIEVVQRSAPGVEPGQYELTLRSAQSDVSVTLTVSTLIPMDETSVNGGWVVVELDTGGGTLVVTEGDSANALSMSRPAGEFGHIGGTPV